MSPARDGGKRGVVTEAAILAEEWPYTFAVNGDEEFEGSCPCGQIHGDGFDLDMHCWRTGRGDGCEGSGVHISGTLPEDRLRKIAEHVRDHNGWTDHCDWHIVVSRLTARRGKK